MPLSEHEQKLLDQMERALYAEDPRFASHMKGTPGSPNRRRVIVGVCIAIAGLATVLAGVTTELIPLGVVGFVVMVAGVAWAATPSRAKRGQTVDSAQPSAVPRAKGPQPNQAGPRASKPTRKTPGKSGGKARGQSKSSGSFIQRMEDRWQKRRDEGQNF